MSNRTCHECGKQFFRYVKPSHEIRGEGRFCSKKCGAKAVGKMNKAVAEAKRPTKNCIVCGKSVSVKPSHLHKEGTYCSKACMAFGYSKRFCGENNPNYKNKNSYSAEYRRTWSRFWRANNKEKVSLWNRNIKAIRKGAAGKHTKEEVLEILRLQGRRCAICKVSLSAFHVDHVIPIARGGTNDKYNIQILCAPCNLRKKAHDPIEHMQKLGYLL